MGRDLHRLCVDGGAVLVETRHAGRLPAALGDASADRPRLRGAGEPAGSAAGHDAVRPTRAADVGRAPGLCPCLGDRLPAGRARRTQLPATVRRAGAVGDVDPVRRRPRRQQRQGEPRPAAAHRVHPAAAGAVPGWILRAPMGTASPGSRRARPDISRASLARRAARGLRAACRGRRGRGAALLLSAEGSRTGPLPLVRLPDHVRDCPEPRRPRGQRVRAARGRLLSRLRAQHLVDAVGAHADVAVTVGQRRARRRADRAGDLEPLDGRPHWNGARAGRHGLCRRRPHRPHARRDRRRTRLRRTARRSPRSSRSSPRAASTARFERPTTTDSSWPRC